jgi:hypothetical protein
MEAREAYFGRLRIAAHTAMADIQSHGGRGAISITDKPSKENEARQQGGYGTRLGNGNCQICKEIWEYITIDDGKGTLGTLPYIVCTSLRLPTRDATYILGINPKSNPSQTRSTLSPTSFPHMSHFPSTQPGKCAL